MHFDPSHNSEIINYYYTNYSTCSKNPSYFATWKFLSTFCHSVLIIETPLVFLTGYCIIKKTPKVMGSLKWAMLNLHVWTSFMDILICSLITPYLFFPTLSGFSVGLLDALGVPTSAQAYLGIVSNGFVFTAITALFENRSSSFQMSRFRFERTTTRFAFFILNGLLFAVILLPVFLWLPDQNAAKLAILQGVPCPTEEFFEFPIFTLVLDDFVGYYVSVVMSLQLTITVSLSLFFICCYTYHIFFILDHVFSIRTRKLQKKFFIGNLVQIAIPSTFWAIPGLLQWVVYFFNYYNQGLNNLCTAVVSLHGLASMIAILLIHHPYRTFIRSLFGVVDSVSPLNSLVITKF